MIAMTTRSSISVKPRRLADVATSTGSWDDGLQQDLHSTTEGVPSRTGLGRGEVS